MPYESYRGVSSHRPFTINEKGVMIAASTLAFPLLARGGRLGLALWKLRPAFIYAGLSPGGGGPGQSLTSTNPPPSLEATGASLTQLGKTEGPARASQRGSRPRRGPKGTLIKCPRGYHWDKKTGRCLKNRKKY